MLHEIAYQVKTEKETKHPKVYSKVVLSDSLSCDFAARENNH